MSLSYRLRAAYGLLAATLPGLVPVMHLATYVTGHLDTDDEALRSHDRNTRRNIAEQHQL